MSGTSLKTLSLSHKLLMVRKSWTLIQQNILLTDTSDQMKHAAITMATRAEEAETQVNRMAEMFEDMRKDYAQLQARNRALDAMLEERYGRLGRIYDYDPEVPQDPNDNTCNCCRRGFD
jgi:hypothetical protein